MLTLLELLQSGGVRTVAELADRLGVDGRTVRRYVQHLGDLDIPVESVRGRYGGYRLAAGHRLPPLMLDDDEALAVLLGLIAGRRAGLTTAMSTAGETAAAKIRRVLPGSLARRLQSVLDSLYFTDVPGRSDQPGRSPRGAGAGGPGGTIAPDAGILLTVADASRQHRPVAIRYGTADSERTVHPYGIVGHADRWYVAAMDAGIGQERTFRLDRITSARALPGRFDPPDDADPAQRVLSGFATAAYRHEVTVWIRGTVEQVRARLPASVATIEPPAGNPARAREPEHDQEAGADARSEAWLRVDLRVQRLDWLPPALASLDLPFEIERPAELRELVLALAERLAARARETGTRRMP